METTSNTGNPCLCGPTSGDFSGEIPGKKRPFDDPKSPENYKWWRKVSAFRSKPTTTDKIKKNPPQKTHNLQGNSTKCSISKGNVGVEREKMQEKLALFRAKCRELSRITRQERGTHRIDFRALQELKKQGKIPNKFNMVIGSIPGVKVGDRFEYRVELMIAGLHRRSQGGIDFTEERGRLVATCIVSTEGYYDKMDNNEVLTYIGEGGMVGQCEIDQKLERGNLALKTSLEVKNDVRVVKGVRFGTRVGTSQPKTTYVYDGLYKVVGMDRKIGLHNNIVFEFQLKRNPAQPSVAWHKFKYV